MTDHKIEIVSYSGYRGEESPRMFIVEGEQVTVTEIVRMWMEEDQENRERKRFFLVKGSDGFLHTLYYDLEFLMWFYRGRERDRRDLS
jgi:hypothetical protein